MLRQIKGLHHVTSIGASAPAIDAFQTGVLGLRRVKKTVNFDAPDVYHLYYGDAVGAPGTVMTYFPFSDAGRGRRGTGEVSVTRFAIPEGTIDAWQERLSGLDVGGLEREDIFGAAAVAFDGPDGDRFALVESSDDRAPWSGGDVPERIAVRGFHSVEVRLAEIGAQGDLLRFMGYERGETAGARTRFALPAGGPASVIDIVEAPGAPAATQGAGSVHHIAFAVENRARQLEVREALVDAGVAVTPVIDRDYFWAIYFRTPGGVLFEIATNEPGFDRDEDRAHLGEALKLPSQHEHLRATLERRLEPIG